MRRAERLQLALDALRLRGERRAVDAHAGALDVDEHRHERQLERAVDLVEPFPLERRRERVGELQREVGALARVVERRLDRQRPRA